jgi:hypothetical protein
VTIEEVAERITKFLFVHSPRGFVLCLTTTRLLRKAALQTQMGHLGEQFAAMRKAPLLWGHVPTFRGFRDGVPAHLLSAKERVLQAVSAANPTADLHMADVWPDGGDFVLRGSHPA